MADNDTTKPGTGSSDASSGTGDNKDDASKAPATGAGTKPATGSASDTDGEAEWQAPSREEWEASQASIKKLELAQKKVNKEAEDRRRQLEDAEKAKLSDDEKKDAEIAAFKAQAEAWKVAMAEAAIEREVTRLIPTLSLVDPDAVVKLLERDSIQFEDGKPAKGEVEREVKALIQSKPYLVHKGGPNPPTRTGANGADATSGSGPKPNLTADELQAAQDAGMTPERYEALKNLKRGATLADWQATRPKAGAGGAN